MKKRENLLDKKKVLKSIKEMPEKFSADDVLDRIMILEKMERAMADSAAGPHNLLGGYEERSEEVAQVIFTEEARSDLRSIHAYISQDSPRFADVQIQRFIWR